jgi:uncharacterized oligopeptide transporter (OPT) family protein
MSGSLVTQYKIAYWLGATPRFIEVSNIVGSFTASATTTLVIALMAHNYGFTPDATHPHALLAPQPNAIAAVLRGVMGEAGTPWFLYGLGAVFALTSQMCGFSGLAFALGMYLPMELNSPLVLGAAIAWLLEHSSKDAPLAKARHDKGTLIASGFIAGGALVGVFAALLQFFDDRYSWHIMDVLNLTKHGAVGVWLAEWGNCLGLLAFVILGKLVYLDGRRAKAA